jgi:DNA topoisomerase-3
MGIRRLCDFLVRYAREDSAAGNFAREDRSKGKSKPKAAAQPLPDVHCPLCKEGNVAENTKAFYCTRYREGCRFTLWKDGLKRGGGPLLTEKLVALLLKEGRLAGSTGTISLEEGFLCFTPKDASVPGLRIPIAYQKAREK